jgi:hypothetical protein
VVLGLQGTLVSLRLPVTGAALSNYELGSALVNIGGLVSL